MEAQRRRSEQPLSGVRVLEMGQILAAPYCTRLLADAGADVVKVESPQGDPSRGLPAVLSEEHSGYFMWLNCGKKSVVADLRNEEDVALVRNLALKADVLVENMRPGTLAKKGLGFETFRDNPSLVMCSISAFGATGIYADRAGQGIVAEGLAGAIDMNGYPDRPPVPLGIALADVSAGLHAYSAILTALYKRDRTDGKGDYIDVSLFDATLPFHETALQEVEFGGSDVSPTRNGLEHRAVIPYGVYVAPDGYLVVAATTEALWRRLDNLISSEIGHSDVNLSSNSLRLANQGEVRKRIERWVALQHTRDNALDALAEAGVPSGPIEQVKDVAKGALARSRRSFVRIPDPVMGEVSVLNTPFRMLNSRVGPAGPAPRLGQHEARDLWSK